ncbi:3-hydroxy-3-methylglutaryl-coenzyme A reductase 1-like [Anneissia japonica]|uniref:3-hydroxy-3-methylglutaryl-coenzyme A reductase 1-like n=1 Tax=Anneissia japonica TaxID=1529436 RepID=UPI0014259CF2|nr:3-hydroxy-3-methylglutaryl-coenzyme A reductase 1-like [Anneissia japonica]
MNFFGLYFSSHRSTSMNASTLRYGFHILSGRLKHNLAHTVLAKNGRVRKMCSISSLQTDAMKKFNIDYASISNVAETSDPLTFKKNIENYIGTVKLPVGVVKVLVNGRHAKGVYTVPMATTEAVLVASYSRGAKVISEAGGAEVIAVHQVIPRAPVFELESVEKALELKEWLETNSVFTTLKEIAESTTNHGKLVKVKARLHGPFVYTQFFFTTGDACGQNMTTIATDAICKHIIDICPCKIVNWLVEGSLSKDKRACHDSLNGDRGVYVTGSVVLPKELVSDRLHTTVDRIMDLNYHVTSGNAMLGSVGIPYQHANALAAIFIACGQDPACIVESQAAITNYRKTETGDIQLISTLPALMVGTVGGGTTLPSQKDCLNLVGTSGSGKLMEFAEVVIATSMAGDLSISAAISCHHFAKAHHKFAR